MKLEHWCCRYQLKSKATAYSDPQSCSCCAWPSINLGCWNSENYAISFASSAFAIHIGKYQIILAYKVNTFRLLVNLFLSWTYFEDIGVDILNDVLLGLSVTEIKEAIDAPTLVALPVFAIGTLSSLLGALTIPTSYHKFLLSKLTWVELILLVSCDCLQLILSEGLVTYCLVNVFVRDWIHLASCTRMTIALSWHLIRRQVRVINGLVHVNDWHHWESWLVNKLLLIHLQFFYLLLISLHVLFVSFKLLIEFCL